MTDNTNNSHPFLMGIRACSLVAIAGGIFGFAFGILAHIRGLTALNTTLMSILVYAGAAQMVSLTLWNAAYLLILALMALPVWLIRLGGFGLAGHFKLSKGMMAWLECLPGCILMAIVAPLMLQVDHDVLMNNI